jgi:hypothetical protein
MAIGVVESWHATRLSGVVTYVCDTPLLGRSAHFFLDRSGRKTPRPCDHFGGRLLFKHISRFAAAIAGCEWDGRENAELRAQG